MKNRFINLYFLTCTIAIFIITLYTVILAKYNVIDQDDSVVLFFSCNDWWETYQNSDHGRYIGNFLLRLIGLYIPMKLGIHPNTWMQTGGAVIKGLLLSLLIFKFALITVNRKVNAVNVPLITLFLYLLLQTQLVNSYQNMLYTSFFGSIFPFFFFISFWSLLYYLYKNPALKNKYNTFLLFLYAFFTGNSNELASIITISAIILFIIINKFLLREKIKSYIFLFITISLSFISMITTRGFLQSAQSKNTFLSISQSLTNAQFMFNEFVNGTCNIFYEKYLIFFIIIFVLFIYILKNKHFAEKSKFINTFFSLLFGGITFYISLIFAGINPDGNSYIQHFDIILEIQIFLTYIIAFELSNINNKKILYLVLFSSSILYAIINKQQINNYFNQIKQEGFISATREYSWANKDMNANRYLSERIMAYYIYKKEPIIFVKDAYSYTFVFEISPRKIYDENYLLSDKNTITYVETIEEMYQKYIENSGIPITEACLKKSDYQDLLNKEFVLTGKK